jgi:7-carboxy-7-deazaguanine synthase
LQSYKVNEIFQTIQGEGFFTGTPAVFIRLQGCPVGCAWCDTKQTWYAQPQDYRSCGEILLKNQESSTWCKLTAAEMVETYRTQGYTAKHIVITGGEPCLYPLIELTEAFEKTGCRCQVETSGTSEVRVSQQTWVTVSPKIAMKGRLPVLSSALQRANEIKHPVGTENDIVQLDQLLAQTKLNRDTIVALQPISQKQRATELCIRVCTERNWCLSIQTHKYLNIA